MKNLYIHIEISPELFLKNPESSELGKNIISESIKLIYSIGIDEFTFKKLGKIINSPESSIYRYFKNKHSLLLYLTSWYWTWTEYKLVFATSNIASAQQRLEIAIIILTKPVLVDNAISHVNEMLLSEIIFSESLKSFHTKNVDEDNKKGCFQAYKNVVKRIGLIVTEINPEYKYPHMLISTVIEGAHHQKYFSEHIPSLTNNTNEEDTISNFYRELVFSNLID